ncbi:uridine kinase family-domain-containing protein [Naematelia encephala]|uniref:Uridine kinase family-domain-containing protein n=1 Tax=Naematelia encephala TaxID=71784 RepID=A0A1Y2B4A0_9TREE|nr:uridine kinase family-domain-containing protein [Naematelia encephala]
MATEHPSRRQRLGNKSQAARGLGSKAKNVVMASHGRAPWYGPDGKNVEAYVIGIAGGSASGKTYVARAILSALDYIPTVLILSQDSFYKKHTPEEIVSAFDNDLDLDHPDAIDMELFVKSLRDLKQGRATEIPVYSFVQHQRLPEKQYIYGASVIIVEGIMAMQSPELRSLYDLKVFVNCDSDLMLARRLRRDIVERGRDVEGILNQYLRFVKNSYDNFVQPSSKFADIIVPGSSNNTAVELLVAHVKRQLDSRSLRFRNMLGRPGSEDEPELNGISGHPDEEALVLLEQKPQLLGLLTILRDRETQRGDFIFYADRLSTLIVEKALSLIPYQPKNIRTPVGSNYAGVAPTDEYLVGISILRSGGPFANGLRRVIRDVPIGAMLIQSDPKTGEPLLLSSDLPGCIKSRETSGNVRALLLDSQLGTGAASLMAIRVLLDHGVPESNIMFLAFLISRRGLASVHRAFPAVKIVTAAIDTGLQEMHFPLTNSNLVIGEAAGEADFAVRVVGDTADVNDDDDDDDDEQVEGYKVDVDHKGNERFRMPVNGNTEGLKFSRKGRRESTVTEKRAWVVTPGLSPFHITSLPSHKSPLKERETERALG